MPLTIIFLLLLLLPLQILSVPFTCTSPPTIKCRSLIGYISPNSTSLSSLQTLFSLPSLSPLLSFNPSLRAHHSLPPNTTVRIPIPCTCNSSTGISDHTPIYTISSSDTGLDFIARTRFLQFVTYQEIAAANGIPDPNVVKVGQKLWIPLPCSCDEVEGEKVVHYGHVVAAGSDLGGIAEEFGTEAAVLMKLNGITDPKTLQAGQVLDVPLKACSSSISEKSVDHDLLLPNGSYALTADNCIKCSCSSSSKYELSCHQVKNSSECPVTKCGDLYIGNSTTSGCDQTTCAYQGYTNSTGLKILSGLTTQNTCAVGNPAAAPSSNTQPGGSSPPNSADMLGLHKHWILLVVLLCLGF